MLAKIKSRLIKHKGTLLFTISNTVLAAANFLGSFICARLLAPSELGAIQTALLLASYLGFLSFGVFNGFNRHYPFLLGKGDATAATLLSRTGYTVGRLTAIIAALIAAGQLLFFWKQHAGANLIYAGMAAIPIVALTQINNLQSAILAGRQSFGWIARAQFITAAATLVLLLLVWKFGVAGQCLRSAAVAAITWTMFGIKTRDAQTWHWDFSAVRELAKIGLPILAVGYLYSVFFVADRTLVASVKGIEAVGYYSLAGLTITAIQSLYMPLAIATYSKANHAYGRSHSHASLVPAVKRFLILVTLTVVPLAAAIYFTLPVVVPWLLPKYVPGIAAAQIACFASVAFCYCGTSFVFNVTGHNRIYGILMACALGAFFLIGYQIPKSELTLELVAWLRAGISVIVCLLINGYLWFYIRRGIRKECSA